MSCCSRGAGGGEENERQGRYHGGGHDGKAEQQAQSALGSDDPFETRNLTRRAGLTNSYFQVNISFFSDERFWLTPKAPPCAPRSDGYRASVPR